MIDNYVVFSALLYMLYEYITLAASASALHCTLHVSTEMVGVL